MEWLPPEKEAEFPQMNSSVYHKTSEETSDYNCIAWAVNDTSQWWEPPFMGSLPAGQYWPEGAPTEIHINSYIKAYEIHGFSLCNDDSLEEGYEKIALYGKANNEPTHAARQLSNGNWTSKLGDWEDIEHYSLQVLEDLGALPAYGTVKHFLKRPVK